jgi:drug/metabolite transporter (DMT)-like permease
MALTRNQNLAIWALIAVAVGYAFLNLAIRLMDSGFEPFTQTYLRILFGALVGFLIFRKHIRTKVIKTTSMKDWLVLLLMGTIGYSAGVLFVTLGALNTTLVNVSVLTSTIPFFVAIYAFFVLRKRISKKLVLLLAVSFIGAAMVATKGFPPLLQNLGIGEVFVLLSAAAFAWYSVGRKMLSNKLNNYEISVLTMVIAAITSLVVALVAGENLNLAAFLDPLVLVGLVIGIGFNVTASLFENFAFQHISVVVGSQLLLLENAISPIIGFLLYAELIGVYEAIGAALIIGSVMLSSRMASED